MKSFQTADANLSSGASRGSKGTGTHRFHISTPAAVLLLIIPTILVLTWHFQNHRWPNDDAADYATTGYLICEQFRTGGFFDGLLAILNLRGWRPVLFPTFLVPFLLLFQNIPLAVGGVLGTLYCLMTVYVYKLARIFVERWKAVLVSTVVMTFPILMHFATEFFAELAWVCFAVAWAYHSIRSEEFRDSVHSALGAVFLSMMVLTRPAESVAITVVPVSYSIIQALRHKTIRGADLILSGIPVIISCGLLAMAVFLTPVPRWETWLFTTLVSVICLKLAFRRSGRFSVGFLLFWICFSTVNALWWAGFERQLYDWVYTTSFGYMAAVTAPPRHAHILTTLGELIDYYGPLEIGWIALLGVLLLISRLLRTKTGSGSHSVITNVAIAEPSRHGKVEERQLWITAAGALFPILVLYWLSRTGDPRRAMVGFVLLLAAFAVAALRETRACLKVHLVLAAALVFLQVWHALPVYLPVPAPLSLMASCCGPLLSPPFRGEDGNEVVSGLLARKLPPNTVLAAYTLALFSFPNRIYEPAALKLALLARKSTINVGYLWDEGAYDRVLRRLAESGYRFILLDRWDNPEVRKSQSYMPYVHFTGTLLDSIAKSDRNPPGLRLINSFVASGREQLLYEIAPKKGTPGDLPEEALLWSDENVAAARNGGRAITSSSQTGFSGRFLNDERRDAWGTAETPDDSYAAVVLARRQQIQFLRLVLFSPQGRAHLRDVSIVATDSEAPQESDWRVIRSRIKGQATFSQKITIPALPDNAVVTIEIDPNDMNAGAHRVWGIACFSSSRRYARNYLAAGAGIYIRELQMRAVPNGNASHRQTTVRKVPRAEARTG